jgi:DNA-binding NtrC family response regulator
MPSHEFTKRPSVRWSRSTVRPYRNRFEAELFGHEKGLLRTPISRRVGRFEQADKGMVFLDEICGIRPDRRRR